MHQLSRSIYYGIVEITVLLAKVLLKHPCASGLESTARFLSRCLGTW